MTVAEQQLKRIQDKVHGLLKQHNALRKENALLKEELVGVREQLSLQQQHIDLLRQQSDVLKLNAAELNEPDKKELEKRINGYIKEIDRCIEMLSG